MLRYEDRTGHLHIWVPFYGDFDLRTCDERSIGWPLRERKGSSLHRIALRYWIRRSESRDA